MAFQYAEAFLCPNRLFFDFFSIRADIAPVLFCPAFIINGLFRAFLNTADTTCSLTELDFSITGKGDIIHGTFPDA